MYNFIAISFAIGLFYPFANIFVPPILVGASELLSSVPVVLFSLTLNFILKPFVLSQNQSEEERGLFKRKKKNKEEKEHLLV